MQGCMRIIPCPGEACGLEGVVENRDRDAGKNDSFGAKDGSGRCKAGKMVGRVAGRA